VNAVARAEGSPERRFTEVMSRHGQAVLGYLARRTQPQHEAADLMAEVFTVAWRRLDQVPEPDEQARAWLIGVARGVLANHQRTAIRRTRLSDRIRAHLHTRPQAFIDTVGEQVEHVRRALGQLSADDREVLTLVAWEEFSSEQAATVLGISPAAARKRLERARTRLRVLLAVEQSPPTLPSRM
jgi:RNA polymerase sigma factor (sigma-70 family)